MRLNSALDRSVNFVEEGLIGFLESRYVRKVDDYFICYLSSQSGCNKACHFCHLTATKQTKFDDALPVDYLAQASRVFKHYLAEANSAKYVNFNFMARGEALANKYLLNQADKILFDLGQLANSFDENLAVRFNVSTIMPRSLDVSLAQIFKIVHPTIYYSLYSTNEDFRRRWMPQAKPVDEALGMLRAYQEVSKKTVKIHHCFIAGENDSADDVLQMLDALDRHALNVEFNLVRYNAFSDAQGKESSDEVIARNMEIINEALRGKAKIIPRVGIDCYASCGTFVPAKDQKAFTN